MEREPAPQIESTPERSLEIKEGADEKAKQEIAKFFEDKLNPEVINRLLKEGYGWTHKRFAVLIEFGQATKSDEIAYIEARNGWREDKALLKKWDDELVKISLEDHGGRA